MEQQALEGSEAFNTRLFEMERRTVELEREREQHINEVAAGGPASLDTHHRHKVIVKPVQWRSNQTRRLVVQVQVIQWRCRLWIPATVRRSGSVSRTDLERHS